MYKKEKDSVDLPITNLHASPNEQLFLLTSLTEESMKSFYPGDEENVDPRLR
ncbi:hypothetical protein [Mangrovibacillus cuniculi]|uniref:Uncharacterized protein n=1 Tax=Mangrovibacillus cuniculi TaxID=2593652 RepID=A0A7S8CAU7_9BACI|nr:hypothetical protein [Mangrovibacillus cuniculi]QPC46569.1 hypothetical protein G8O30_06105 [Mangrovibacillus cuniculi]